MPSARPCGGRDHDRRAGTPRPTHRVRGADGSGCLERRCKIHPRRCAPSSSARRLSWRDPTFEQLLPRLDRTPGLKMDALPHCPRRRARAQLPGNGAAPRSGCRTTSPRCATDRAAGGMSRDQRRRRLAASASAGRPHGSRARAASSNVVVGGSGAAAAAITRDRTDACASRGRMLRAVVSPEPSDACAERHPDSVLCVTDDSGATADDQTVIFT